MKVFGNVDKTKDEHLNIYYSLEEKKAKRKDNTPLHLPLKIGEHPIEDRRTARNPLPCS